MKIVRYSHAGTTGYGELVGGDVHPLKGVFPDLSPAAGTSTVALSDVQLLAPCEPSKIVAVGPNHHAHMKGKPIPPRAFLWIKPTTTVNDPDGIVYLPRRPLIVCHEAELAIVIGKRATRVTREQALDYVFGYTCILDMSVGVGQPGHHQSQEFVDGKIFDTFAPLGPWIETQLDPDNVRVQCRVNGETRQNDMSSGMIWDAATLIAQVTDTVTLLPGDVIACGTVPGMSPVHDGDALEAEVEGIGILRAVVRDLPHHAG